jgi:hypothetical protein
VSALSETFCIDAEKSEKAAPPAPEQEYAFLLPSGSRKRQSLSSLQHAMLFFSGQIWGVADSCECIPEDVFFAVGDRFITPEVDFNSIRARETISLSPRLELTFALPHLKFGTTTTRNSFKSANWLGTYTTAPGTLRDISSS